jgi:hypothetical protein
MGFDFEIDRAGSTDAKPARKMRYGELFHVQCGRRGRASPYLQSQIRQFNDHGLLERMRAFPCGSGALR